MFQQQRRERGEAGWGWMQLILILKESSFQWCVVCPHSLFTFYVLFAIYYVGALLYVCSCDVREWLVATIFMWFFFHINWRQQWQCGGWWWLTGRRYDSWMLWRLSLISPLFFFFFSNNRQTGDFCLFLGFDPFSFFSSFENRCDDNQPIIRLRDRVQPFFPYLIPINLKLIHNLWNKCEMSTRPTWSRKTKKQSFLLSIGDSLSPRIASCVF